MSKVADLSKRRYEAASQSTRTRSWNTPGTDANSAITNPAILRNRSRDLVRNNPWAAKGVSVIVNNTIGYGIRAQFKHSNKRLTKQAQALWQSWAETTQCDAAGLSDIYGLQQLIMRAMVESGECLVRLRPRLASDGLAVPLQLQVLEPDYLYENNQGSLPNGGYIHRGIEYDAVGRRVAYYLYKYHPGSSVATSMASLGAYSRVPAEQIIHVFRQDRPGQERGVPWLTPGMIRLRELDIYEDAYLNRQKLANLFAAFVRTSNPEDTEIEFSKLDELISGSMYILKDGMEMQFSDPPKADDYGPYTLNNLRAVAAAWNITYEALTGDLSEVNFSSARMGWQEFGRSVDAWRWQLFIPRVCQRIGAAFLEASRLAGFSIDWTPPARTMVDPAREVPPIKDAIRIGILSPQEAIREQGYDPLRQLEEFAAWNTELDRLNVKLDSDARNPASGAVSTQTTQEAQNAGNTDTNTTAS